MRRVIAILAAAVIAITGCVQQGPAGSAPGGSQPGVSAAAFPKEIALGAVYPLTGSQAPTGIDLKNGIDLAVELINSGKADFNLPLVKDGGGLKNLGGAKLKIVYGDSQADPQKGQSETERLITSEKVTAMLGAYNSAVTATASQAAERLAIPFVNPDSSSPTLVTNGYNWFFRSTPAD